MGRKSGKLIHRSRDGDLPIEVIQERGYRSLYFGSGLRQSCCFLEQPERLVLPYTRYMMAALLFLQKLDRVLVIGLGGGSLVRFLRHYVPEAQVDVVEISPRVTAIAREFFLLEDDERVAIEIGDAARFLQEAPRPRYGEYDLILVDAFGQKGMAASVYAEGFIHDCADRLAPGGVVSINAWKGDEERWRAAWAALKRRFDGQTLQLPVSKESGNEIFLGLSGASPWKDGRALSCRAENMERTLRLEFVHMLNRIHKSNGSFLKRFLSWM